MLQFYLPKDTKHSGRVLRPGRWQQEFADNGIPQSDNDPANYATDKDVAVFLYEVPELTRLKDELNKKKKSLDIVTDQKKFSRIVEVTRGYSKLLGRNGILSKEKNAEDPTNAWVKQAEEHQTFVKPHFFDGNDHSFGMNNPFLVLLVAEAPGNFLLAENHLLTVPWAWRANSYIGAKDANEGYLGDTYGLMRKYKNKWVYGADGDGDVTSVANVTTIRQTIYDAFKTTNHAGNTVHRKVHLFTSDVKYVVAGEYDEEERMNVSVQTGAIVCALVTLAKGGVAILKHFSLFEGASIALLQLLCENFKEVVVTKPETSRSGNSEVYIVCVDFLDKKVDVDGLYAYLTYIRYMNKGEKVPALYEKCDPKLTAAVVDLEEKLVARQKESITSYLAFWERYKNKLQEMEVEYEALGNKISRAWIERYQIPVMDPSKRMK